MAARGQCSYRPTITPNKTCFANLYRRINRMVRRSLKQTHCKRHLVPSEQQVADQLPKLKAVFLALKEFQDLCIHKIVLVATSNTTVVSYIKKEGGMRSGPLCALLWRLDLVHQKSSNSQNPTHSRPAECSSRQASQIRPDHPNRVVSPSGGLPSKIQQVAPASNRPICHEVKQQVPLFVSLVPDSLATAVDTL